MGVSNERIRCEAGAAVTSCTCPRQCDKIVADTQEIHYETNTTIEARRRHLYKV